MGKRYMQVGLTEEQFKQVRVYLANKDVTFQELALELLSAKVGLTGLTDSK